MTNMLKSRYKDFINWIASQTETRSPCYKIHFDIINRIKKSRNKIGFRKICLKVQIYTKIETFDISIE